MNRITKVAFKKAYNGLIGVAAPAWNKETCRAKTIDILKDQKELPSFPISKYSLDSQSAYGIEVTVYTEIIGNNLFYFVETKIDYSKDKYTSWNDIQYHTVIYRKK